MLKLWGRLDSINVQKVVWSLEEVGAAYERIDAGRAFGIVDTPAFRRLNPNGLVPVLEDGDHVLWESNAIVRHLARAYPAAGLWPESLQDRADADRWIDWQAGTFYPAFNPAFHQLIRTPPGQRDTATIEAARARSETMTALLDEHLRGRDHVLGDAFTAADIVLGCAAHRWFALPLAREERPRLRAWYERVRARPAAGRALLLPLT